MKKPNRVVYRASSASYSLSSAQRARSFFLPVSEKPWRIHSSSVRGTPMVKRGRNVAIVPMQMGSAPHSIDRSA